MLFFNNIQKNDNLMEYQIIIIWNSKWFFKWNSKKVYFNLIWTDVLMIFKMIYFNVIQNGIFQYNLKWYSNGI